MPDQPKPKRRLFQYSLRTLLVLVAAIGIVMATVVMPAVRQRQAVEQVQRFGGMIFYGYQYSPDGTEAPGNESAVPAWLRRTFGEDCFANVTGVVLDGSRVHDPGREFPFDADNSYGEILDALRRLPKLRRLRVERIPLAFLDLAKLSSSPNLEIPEVKSLAVENTDLPNVAHLSHLHELRLELKGSEIDGFGCLGALTDLEVLSLGNSRISDAGIADLSGLTKLSELDLPENTITDVGCDVISQFSNLTRLDLCGAQITDVGLAKLGALRELRWLNLSDAQITDAGLQQLGLMMQLIKLTLRAYPRTPAVRNATIAN